MIKKTILVLLGLTIIVTLHLLTNAYFVTGKFQSELREAIFPIWVILIYVPYLCSMIIYLTGNFKE